MIYSKLYINAIGHVIPPIEVTSEELEYRLYTTYERLRLSVGRLELMTGIKSRRVWPVGTMPSSIASEAANKLFLSSSISKDDVDLLIFGSVCRNFLEPATAAVVHSDLSLRPDCAFFDLSNACVGVLTAIEVAGAMIEAGAIKNALIVSGENGSPLLEKTIEHINNNPQFTRNDIKKFLASLTIGSGGVALMLSNDPRGAHFKVRSSQTMTDSAAQKLCQGSGDGQGLMMETDAEQLLEAGIELAKSNWQRFLEQGEMDLQTFSKVICHQVGRIHRDRLFDSLKIPLEYDYSTFEYTGNTGSAALPTALSLAKQNGVVKSGDRLALLGIGSGLACTMMDMECIND